MVEDDHLRNNVSLLHAWRNKLVSATDDDAVAMMVFNGRFEGKMRIPLKINMFNMPFI